MEKTIFERIAQKEIPAYVIHEDADFMAFLDIAPSSFAQTIVIPKVQKDSYVFKHDQEFMSKYWEYIRKIALLLDEKLGTLRTIVMFEGFEVNHLHAKLYPILNMQEAENFNPRKKGELTKEEAQAILKKINS